MTITRSLFILGMAAVFTLAAPKVEQTKTGDVALNIGASEADAGPRHVARRSARRTARRTSRRVSRRYAALPSGCAWRAPYYYCGGVYYQPYIEDGTEVYIIVTP